jgi:hypothetical protein
MPQPEITHGQEVFEVLTAISATVLPRIAAEIYMLQEVLLEIL